MNEIIESDRAHISIGIQNVREIIACTCASRRGSLLIIIGADIGQQSGPRCVRLASLWGPAMHNLPRPHVHARTCNRWRVCLPTLVHLHLCCIHLYTDTLTRTSMNCIYIEE